MDHPPRFPPPFVGARTRRIIGQYLGVVHCLRVSLLLARWAMHLGWVRTTPENDARCALAILRGQAATPVTSDVPVYKEDAWMLQSAYNGVLGLLVWLHARASGLHRYTLQSAVRGGHMHVLNWMRDIGTPWEPGMCATAAEAGRWEVLQWVHDKNWFRFENGYHTYWEIETCYAAARHGHLTTHYSG